MAVTVKVTGFRELDRALSDLKRATAKNVARKVLVEAGKPMAEAMRARAPDDPATTGTLRDSIGVGVKLTARQSKVSRKGSPVEAYVGAGKVPHAHLQEFGTAHHVAQPFARPGFDAEAMPTLERIRDGLELEIAKAVERASRKAARAARKAAKG